MKQPNISLTLKTLAIAGAASLFMTGCITETKERSDYNSDGQAAYMTTEVDQMGQVYDQVAEGTSRAAKSSAFGINIGAGITGELVIEPFAYDSSCTCFIRHAVFNGKKGYERDRVDSVTLLDSTGATMDKWKRSEIAKIIHKRNVVHSKGANEADVRFDIVVDIKTESGVRKGVWNGTMSGTYNGQDFKSGTMTNVIRPWVDGRFRFPEAGTIEIDRPVFHLLVEFLGDSKAKVTIRNKVNQKIHILFVDKDYNESDPTEQP